MSHTAELIAVGTELLLGNIANTDAQFISQGLSALGINVYYHTVVGDNPDRLRAAVELARTRADILITTGGLGPTCDDLTKNVLAGCFGVPGLACAALTILAMACGSEPFGYDYLYPLMPPGRASVRDGFVRSIWSRLAKSGEVISRHEA